MGKFVLYIGFVLCVVSVQAQQAGFTVSQPSKCAPSTVTFTNTSTGNPSSYLWDFGDGTANSTTKDPQHPFQNAGTYTVTLTTYYGSTPSTSSQTITVLPPPAFSFRKLNDSVCPGGSVSFSSTVTYPSNSNAIRSYLWNFGDGGSSSAANPTYTYMNVPNQPVRYTVSLTITDTNGCSSKDSVVNYIYVKPKPIVNFGVDRQIFCVPDTPAVVTFTDSTTVTTNNTYLWQFSDGTQSTQKNPVKTFRGVGTFSASLTVTSPEGCSNTLSKTRLVEVIDFKRNIEASDTILCSIPAGVSFRAVPTPSTNIKYFWNFGDGGTGQSDFFPIQHTYDTVGTYIVTLIADYNMGMCFAYDTIRVHVYEKDSVTPWFSINGSTYHWDTVLCDFQYPNFVTFKDVTKYPTADNWGFGSTSWWFGDGDSAMRYNIVSHKFSRDTNYYRITMRITTPYGCPIETTRSIWFHSDTIVKFFSSAGGCAPYNAEAMLIQECWDSKAVILILDWGDGTPKDTIYDWDTTCWNPLNNWGNWSQLKSIYDESGDSCCTNFLGLCVCKRCPGWVPPWVPCVCGPPKKYHTYVDTGVFMVTLTFTNLAGCTYTRIDSTAVGCPPKAWFTWKDTMACLSDMGNALTFVQAFDSVDAQGKRIACPANSWYWSNTKKHCPWVVYTDTTTLRACDTGYQHIFMVPYHNYCPGDTVFQDSVSYLCPPWAGFLFEGMSEVSPVFCDYPAQIKLDNISLGATSYLWFLGDAEDLDKQTTDTNKNPTLTYSHSNPFLFQYSGYPGVRLTLVAINDDTNKLSPTYNRCGHCEDTAVRYFFISEGFPKLSTGAGNVCQGNEVRFYDSGYYNSMVVAWVLRFYPSNPANNEHTAGYGSWLFAGMRDKLWYSIDEFTNYPSPFIIVPPPEYIDIQRDGFPLIFKNMDNYTAILNTIDEFGCIRSDTINFSIYPQSKISFVSGKDNVHFTKGRDTLCANYPDILYLRDSSYTLPPFSSTNIVQWKWKIGYDTLVLKPPFEVDTLFIAIDSSTLKNPIFPKLTKERMYDLSLHIVNEYGCTTDSVFKNQILVNKITAAFYPGRPWYCNHSEVEFYNLSYILPREYNRNAKFTYIWDFGDGSPTFTNTNVSERVYHTYNLQKLPATVNVTLTVWADSICSDVFVSEVVIAGPIASFIDDGNQFPCPDKGRPIHFQSTSTGNKISYYWNFGDTISSTNESYLQNPVHDYLRAGYYDVMLIVKDAENCADTLFAPQHVFIDGPIGNFTYGELSGCVEHSVVFVPSTINTDSVIVNPDGANPQDAKADDTLFYTYKLPNKYIPYFYIIKWVKDTITNDSIRCVVEWAGKDTIYVIDMVPNFDTDSLYCSRSPVDFPNTTTVLPQPMWLDSTIWHFGNGNSLCTTDGYVQYDSTGIYNVTMTVYAKNCMKQLSKSVEIVDIVDTVYTGPDSAFSCGTELTVFFDANFDDELPDRLAPQYEWRFDDSVILYGNPASRTFYSSGNYSYQLLITFGQSNCLRTSFNTIEVLVPDFPTAEFEPNPQTVSYGEEIKFIDKSIQGDGKLVYWYWNFGDSTESELQNPTHNYLTTSGYMTVLLWIEDEYGCTDSISHEVLILESLDFPSIFTPIGSDGKRYYFRPIEEKGYFKDFEIVVYDRWGNFVWKNSCTNPNCPDYYNDSFWWNGTNIFGNPISYGVYFWVVKATPLSANKPLLKNGSVTVIGN